jgi:hypothetical protein
MSFDYQQRLSTKIPESAISTLLNKMSMESVFCTHSTFSSPWGISMPPINNCMMFHLVIEGIAKLKIQSDHIEMNAGDFIILPNGTGHSLSDGATSIYTSLNDLPIEIVNESFERLRFGGDGEKTIMLCGAITFRHPLTIRLLGILPNEIAINKTSNANDVVNKLADLLTNEAFHTAIGS